MKHPKSLEGKVEDIHSPTFSVAIDTNGKYICGKPDYRNEIKSN